jgi:hypothetical protein
VARPCGSGRSGVYAARLGQLQRLQHGFVVLVLVLDQHLRDERGYAPEHRERPGAHLVHVRERLVAPQVGQLTPVRAWRLESVVGIRQVGAHQVEPRLPADPQVLEGRYVPEVPDERAHQRIVHPVQIGVGHVLDQQQRALASFFELFGLRLDPSEGPWVCDMEIHGWAGT